MRPDHLPHLVELDGDPEVMRYLIGRARSPAQARREWAPGCESTAADAVGLGYWVGFADGEFVGWWCASPPEPITQAPSTAELGWRLRREFWGCGLATEGARAVVEHSFGTVGLGSVTAETMAVNVGSRGVMRKLGMSHVRTEMREWDDPLPGTEQGEVIYELLRADWRG
ncbi:N-acetyltransferase [Occultella glacieicola]|uniref:N-acetyltransferase n=2 Tax=Occultella glacieicola TaxID=2518684 RepID=A0ABY2E9H3_9MICO|nr:N-acetyltransferase [Occultella glacieicola]